MSALYLVDEHRLLRDTLQSVLEQHGHQVLGHTSNPTQALADLQRLQPQVLLLDLNLGPCSGLELLDGVRRRGLAVRAMVLTRLARPRQVAEALRLGAVAYLLKDTTVPELLQAITAVLAGQRHFSPEVAALAVQALSMDSAEPSLALLSAREQQVIRLVVLGHSSINIGALLHLSPKTVDSYRSRLMAKLQVPEVTALVRLALRIGLIGFDEL